MRKKYILLVAAVMLLFSRISAFAQDLDERMEITGFAGWGENPYVIYCPPEEKPDFDTLQEFLPKTLGVYVNGGEDIVEIPVTWYCVGEDFDTSDDYYFQFSPRWDTQKYVLSEEQNVERDAPYIAVHLNSGIQLFSVTSNSNETIIYEFLRNEMQFNEAAACGILANIYKESAFDPNALGDRGTSYGICQWHNERWTSMRNWCEENGLDWTDVRGQLLYLQYELSQNSNTVLWNGRTIYDYLSSVENTQQGAYDAGFYWCFYYEIPADRHAAAVVRGNLARDVYWQEYKAVDMPLVFNEEDGNWYYYENEEWISDKYGFVNHDEGRFLVANGMVVTGADGLFQDPEEPDNWYFLSAGQVQLDYTGLTLYDGVWFYVADGKMDANYSGYVEYDDSLFLTGAGRILTEANGLVQNPENEEEWYYVAGGQAQRQYTGLVQYDKAWFYVEDGRLCVDYTGEVEYDGEIFYVEDGMMIA